MGAHEFGETEESLVVESGLWEVSRGGTRVAGPRSVLGASESGVTP